MEITTENGEEITVTTLDNETLEALEASESGEYETVIENQAEIIKQLENVNTELTEINSLVGIIFGALLLYGVYRFLSGVISSMFGGG